MRRPLEIVLSTATIIPLLFVGNAVATPSKSSVCSGCHSLTGAVTVTPTFQGCNGSNASYSVVVSNTYSGAEGWAVFDGGTNTGQNALGASGSFTVPGGRSYDVWGVSKGSSDMGGSNYATITAECGGSSCTPTGTIENRRQCFDGLDNDCDGLTDAAYPDCVLEICDNGVDDDRDGKTDCRDRRDCNKNPVCHR